MKKLILAFICLFLAGSSQAKIITVDDDKPADFSTIQAAIDDSNDDDTIIVKPGLYTEHIRFYGKNITVTSTKPIDFNVVAATIINYGVVFSGSEDPNCQLVGFKINGLIYGGATHATISHCILSGNSVPYGTVIRACDGIINNCIVADNVPAGDAIGSAISECHGLIKNCTIARNILGVHVAQQGMTSIENCIIYHNCSGQVGVAGTLNIQYTDVEDGLQGIYGGGIVNWGLGNIEADPCFVRIGIWCGEIEGDYHPKSQAGRWDANDQNWVQDANTSPCIDAGNPHSPIGLEPFPNGGRINMGAYGGTKEASKSYFGWPVCEIIIAGDINGDCRINFLDFQLMALHWLECIEPNQGQGHSVEDDTEDSYSCEGDFDVSFPCSNAVDEDWDTYALPADGGATSYIYENYIIPAGITMAELTIKYGQTAAVTPGLCTNVTDYWDGSTWKELDCTALTNQISILTVEIPDDALSGTTLKLRTPTWKSLGIPGSGSGMYYEGKVIWYLLPVCQTIVAGGNKQRLQSELSGL